MWLEYKTVSHVVPTQEQQSSNILNMLVFLAPDFFQIKQPHEYRVTKRKRSARSNNVRKLSLDPAIHS